MQCSNCKNEIIDGSTHCTYCGQEIKQAAATPTKDVKPKKNKWVSWAVFLVFIAIGAYSSFTDVGVQKNEVGIDLLDKGGDYSQAIENFAEAYNNVEDSEDKITILKNWAYAYWSNNQLTESKQKFQEALAISELNSADYYLIKGEIAYLDEDAALAEENYLKAVALEPDSFQINSSLGVFYQGIDDISYDFTDYDQALIYTGKAYEVKPESEMVKENLASNYFYLGEYQQALDLYKLTTLENKPYNNYMIGLCYLGLKDDAQAIIYIQKSMDLGFEPEQEVLEYLNLDAQVD